MPSSIALKHKTRAAVISRASSSMVAFWLNRRSNSAEVRICWLRCLPTLSVLITRLMDCLLNLTKCRLRMGLTITANNRHGKSRLCGTGFWKERLEDQVENTKVPPGLQAGWRWGDIVFLSIKCKM